MIVFPSRISKKSFHNLRIEMFTRPIQPPVSNRVFSFNRPSRKMLPGKWFCSLQVRVLPHQSQETTVQINRAQKGDVAVTGLLYEHHHLSIYR